MNTEFGLNGSDPSFAIYLSDNGDSFLEYGPADPDQMTGSLTWIPNTKGPASWGNDMKGVKISGGDYFEDI